MKPSYIIILLMVAIFVVSFGSGYALCLIDKKIKWEVQFHKTAQKLRDIEVKGNAPSLDWIIGARWALNNMIQKENKK